MPIFGGLEELFSGYIYPVWPLVAAAAVAALIAALYGAYRIGLHKVANRHRFITSGLLAVVQAVTVPVGYHTISPLFERVTVC